ncbi:uncharacterized protein V6R79_007347 [Siganus canaliculatus]
MSCFPCCCCLSSGNSDNERQPLLHPSPPDQKEVESARQTRAAHSGDQTVRRIGRLTVRRVCVPELDQRFSDIAEAFNEQQESYEALVQHIHSLRQLYGCNHNENLGLAECVGKIREEHEVKYRITLKLNGYDFFLNVVPVVSEEEPLPPHLKLAQDEVKCTSDSAKATISKGTALQELIGWLLRSKNQIAEQVNEAADTFQEKRRLTDNLEENVVEVRRAKELSNEYRQRAGEVLTDAAQIAGAKL